MSQIRLFDSLAQAIPLPEAEIMLWHDFLNPEQARWLMDHLLDNVQWRQDKIKLFGKTHDLPRLQQWFADEGLSYTWSGIRMEPGFWPKALLRLRNKLTRETGRVFNTVLANCYRDGRDTVGWHADDESELGTRPVIASLSLGAERDFQLRHRFRTDLPVTTVTLASGSLLLMGGDTQKNWQHCVPRRKRITQPRINLTFRQIQPTGRADLSPGQHSRYNEPD